MCLRLTPRNHLTQEQSKATDHLDRVDRPSTANKFHLTCIRNHMVQDLKCKMGSISDSRHTLKTLMEAAYDLQSSLVVRVSPAITLDALTIVAGRTSARIRLMTENDALTTEIAKGDIIIILIIAITRMMRGILSL